MPFPTTDRLKNLIETVAGQSETAWASHPFMPATYLGLVVGYYNTTSSADTLTEGDADDSNGSCLKVIPLPLTSVSQAGDLKFNLNVPSDVTKLQAVRVYPADTAAADVQNTYTTGTVIGFWTYWGDGDNADKVRGSFVTLKSASLPKGQYQYMNYTMVSQNQSGWGFSLAHPM